MREYVFADEAGDFDCRRDHRGSKYFNACAVGIDNCNVGQELLKLRRMLSTPPDSKKAKTDPTR